MEAKRHIGDAVIKHDKHGRLILKHLSLEEIDAIYAFLDSAWQESCDRLETLHACVVAATMKEQWKKQIETERVRLAHCDELLMRLDKADESVRGVHLR